MSAINEIPVRSQKEEAFRRRTLSWPLPIIGLRLAQEAILGEKCDVLILDEINVAVEWNLISLDEQLGLIRTKPEKMELIMTGRYARQEVIDAADLVTEMEEVKHCYKEKKVCARKGFEF